MRIKIIVTSLALVVLIASRGGSQPAVKESFDYPLGSGLHGLGTAGNGWAGPWEDFVNSTATMVIADTGLAYEDLNYSIPNVGNHVTGVTTGAWTTNRWGRYLEQTWPDEAGKTYWFSVIMELKNWNYSNSWAGGIGVYDSTSEGPLLGKGWGDLVYSYGSGAPSGTEKSIYTWDVGPVWLVARMDMSGDANPETLHMWVNPDPTGGEPDTTVADTRSHRSVNKGFNRIVTHFGGEGVGMEFNVDEIRVGTSWDDVSSPISAVTSIPDAPATFKLSQNYPNPFNPSTTISYTLKSTGKVRLTVYDMIGQEVAVLVDGIQNADEHEVVFSGAGLPSGIYFYRLQTANEVITKKMALVK